MGWTAEGLLWITVALPIFEHASFPRLSPLQLKFVASSTTTHSVKPSIRDTDSDLRWAVDEVARIERGFEGAVNITVSGSSVQGGV